MQRYVCWYIGLVKGSLILWILDTLMMTVDELKSFVIGFDRGELCNLPNVSEGGTEVAFTYIHKGRTLRTG